MVRIPASGAMHYFDMDRIMLPLGYTISHVLTNKFMPIFTLDNCDCSFMFWAFVQRQHPRPFFVPCRG